MKTLEEIQKHLDETVNTLLGQHRGRVDISSVDRRPNSEMQSDVHVTVAYVKMSGGCRGCDRQDVGRQR